MCSNGRSPLFLTLKPSDKGAFWPSLCVSLFTAETSSSRVSFLGQLLPLTFHVQPIVIRSSYLSWVDLSFHSHGYISLCTKDNPSMSISTSTYLRLMSLLWVSFSLSFVLSTHYLFDRSIFVVTYFVWLFNQLGERGLQFYFVREVLGLSGLLV